MPQVNFGKARKSQLSNQAALNGVFCLTGIAMHFVGCLFPGLRFVRRGYVRYSSILCDKKY